MTSSPTHHGAEPASGTPAAPGPLSGVVIADFSRVLAGPYTTMLLADMGATVIKVESPTGDPDRDPQRAGVALFDVITGLHAAMGILAALMERRSSGLGQHLALDLFSSALSGLVNQTNGFAASGNGMLLERHIGRHLTDMEVISTYEGTDSM